MFQYEAPKAVEGGRLDRKSRKQHEATERAIHRGLATIKREATWSLEQLKKQIEQEAQRTERARAAAPTCPGSSLRVGEHTDGTHWVRQDVKMPEDAGHAHVVEIPVRHYWDVTLRGEAWGQFSRWMRMPSCQWDNT